MSTILCPMLTALKPQDDEGRPVDRECIYEQCRFFDLERRDCQLMLASRAMLRMADDHSRGPAAAGTDGESAGLESRVEDMNRQLGRVTGEVREALRDSSAEISARMAALESKQDALEESLAARLERRLEKVEEAAAHSADPLRTTIEEQGLTFAARLDEAMQDVSNTASTCADLKSRVDALSETQQKAAERVLEELSLVGATLQKLEQTVAAVDRKIEASASEGMNLAQVMTLVKGETERTYAALRQINEGNRTVLDAIEAQLRRDREELGRRHRDEAMSLNNRGVVLYYRGALEAAVGAFRQAVHLHPDYAEAFNNLGLALSRMGRGEDAVEAFQQALKLDPKMGEAYNNLGFLYHTSAQFERAVQMFDQAIENAADSSIAYTNLGNTFYKMQQPDKAVQAWTRALELDPMNENARRGLRMFQQDGAGNSQSAA